MRFITPAKATREYVLQQGWAFYEWDVDLSKDLLVGPFELQVVGNEPNRIPMAVWKDLKQVASAAKMDTSDITRVIPLA